MCRRKEPIIAIGGGVCLDVCGLAANLYRRNTPVIKVRHTTSACDSLLTRTALAAEPGIGGSAISWLSMSALGESLIGIAALLA